VLSLAGITNRRRAFSGRAEHTACCIRVLRYGLSELDEVAMSVISRIRNKLAPETTEKQVCIYSNRMLVSRVRDSDSEKLNSAEDWARIA
jgi:hypothetical protein